MKSTTLVEIIKKTKILTHEQLEQALRIQKQGKRKLLHVLVEDGLIPEKDLVLAISSSLDIPAINLAAYKPDSSVLNLLPKRIAERYEVFPISCVKSSITLAMSDPLDVFALDDLKSITHCQVRIVLAAPRDIQTAIETHYSEKINYDEMSAEDVDSVEVLTPDMPVDYAAGGGAGGDEAPVIRMVNLVLQEAIKNRASDIHFEPYEDRLRIRFRIDGALREAFTPPRDMYNAVLSRVKIVSDLDITEKRLPQDGRFRAKFENREIDFRVSVLPTYHGEKTVLRILDKNSLKIGLEQLGYHADSINCLETAITRPYGMVLVTGPTGSGKSTTLYSVLNKLNTKDRNIMTIEDPVEYQVEGITQTQVNNDIGLSFSNGLRALLRQSPDIILVGEIRDQETADIAVKSALTGHLVFSTLHTNNASGAVSRLVDMGVEPFLLSSSLIAVTAQRLMRKICTSCMEEYEVSSDLLARFPKGMPWPDGKKARRGKGCKICKNTGYYGRLATMEILLIDEEIQPMVVNRASGFEIERVARKKGMRTLFEDALLSAIDGRTTIEEVFRVTSMED